MLLFPWMKIVLMMNMLKESYYYMNLNNLIVLEEMFYQDNYEDESISIEKSEFD